MEVSPWEHNTAPFDVFVNAQESVKAITDNGEAYARGDEAWEMFCCGSGIDDNGVPFLDKECSPFAYFDFLGHHLELGLTDSVLLLIYGARFSPENSASRDWFHNAFFRKSAEIPPDGHSGHVEFFCELLDADYTVLCELLSYVVQSFLFFHNFALQLCANLNTFNEILSVAGKVVNTVPRSGIWFLAFLQSSPYFLPFVPPWVLLGTPSWDPKFILRLWVFQKVPYFSLES